MAEPAQWPWRTQVDVMEVMGSSLGHVKACVETACGTLEKRGFTVVSVSHAPFKDHNGRDGWSIVITHRRDPL